MLPDAWPKYSSIKALKTGSVMSALQLYYIAQFVCNKLLCFFVVVRVFNVKGLHCTSNDSGVGMLYFSRSKYYHFEEFLGLWLEKLKAADKTSMTVKLMKDIDRYRVSALLVLLL